VLRCKSQVPSFKLQVASSKFQVPSSKLQVPSCKFQATSFKLQAASSKQQVSSCKLQVPSGKFQALGYEGRFGCFRWEGRSAPRRKKVARGKLQVSSRKFQVGRSRLPGMVRALLLVGGALGAATFSQVLSPRGAGLPQACHRGWRVWFRARYRHTVTGTVRGVRRLVWACLVEWGCAFSG
jgi:hypothetical protein